VAKDLRQWLADTGAKKTMHMRAGKVESKKRLPLFHTPDYGWEITQSLTALH
jgi:hypothetical protein